MTDLIRCCIVLANDPEQDEAFAFDTPAVPREGDRLTVWLIPPDGTAGHNEQAFRGKVVGIEWSLDQVGVRLAGSTLCDRVCATCFVEKEVAP